MRKSAISLALLASVFSTGALAREDALYLEVDGGITAPNNSDYDSVADPDIVGTVEWGSGLDLGAIVGYDFGGFRVVSCPSAAGT